MPYHGRRALVGVHPVPQPGDLDRQPADPSAHYEFRNEWEISRRLRRSIFPVADSAAAKEWAVTLAFTNL